MKAESAKMTVEIELRGEGAEQEAQFLMDEIYTLIETMKREGTLETNVRMTRVNIDTATADGTITLKTNE